MHLQIFFFVPDPPPTITIPGISDCGSALPVKSFVKAAISFPKAAILLVRIKGITNFWKNPKKNLRFYDCSIKTYLLQANNYTKLRYNVILLKKIALFLKVMSMPRFNQFYTFMLLNLSYLHTALLIVSTTECVSSLLRNVLVVVFNFFRSLWTALSSHFV